MIAWLEAHPNFYEILRYLIAGGLTTLLSLVTHYGFCFLFAQKEKCTTPGFGARLRWFGQMVNRANAKQMALASILSWIISVLFAFWINRGMVFRAQNSGNAWAELGKFAAGRIVSYLLFELGLAQLLKKWGVNNMVNRVITTVLVMVFNYVVSKFIVF